jgi:branched-chain amino acid transport system permease protein
MKEKGPYRAQETGSAGAAAVPAPATSSAKRRQNLLRHPIRNFFLLLLAAMILIYPFLDEGLQFRKITTIIPLLIFMILTLGLNIVVGYAGLLDLGYAAFFAIGAYVAGFMTSPLSFLNPGGHMSWYSNFWIALVVAFLVALLAGMVLGAPTLRLRGDYLAIVTLGFGEIVPVVFRNSEGITYGEKGLSAIQHPMINIGPINFEIGGGAVFGLPAWSSQLPWYYFILALGILCIFGSMRLYDSRVGRAWMAMREDEIAASAMGINLVTTKLSAFGMGASLSGVAGATFGAYIGSIFPSQFEFSLSVILLCAVILGGLGNIWGVILGGFIIQSFDRILAPELTNFLKGVGQANHINFLATIELSNWRYFIFGAALVIMMLVRPQGLLPNKRRAAEMTAGTVVDEGGQATDEPSVEPTPIEQQEREQLYDMRGKN